MVRRYISVVSMRSLTAPSSLTPRGWSASAPALMRSAAAGHRGDMVTSVMWFRRDLRLGDNPALLAACAEGEVLPLFVLDPLLWSRSGTPRRAYLARSLAALSAATGGALVVRSGDPTEVVPAVAARVGARTVHCAADFAPYGRRRDAAVEEALTAAGGRLERLPGAPPPGAGGGGGGGGG